MGTIAKNRAIAHLSLGNYLQNRSSTNGGCANLNQFADLTSNRGLGIVHANSGLGKLYWDTQEATEVMKMRSLCQEQGGFLTVLESPTSLKQQIDPWGYTGNALEMMRKLKQQFDSNQILSLGRFVGGI